MERNGKIYENGTEKCHFPKPTPNLNLVQISKSDWF